MAFYSSCGKTLKTVWRLLGRSPVYIFACENLHAVNRLSALVYKGLLYKLPQAASNKTGAFLRKPRVRYGCGSQMIRECCSLCPVCQNHRARVRQSGRREDRANLWCLSKKKKPSCHTKKSSFPEEYFHRSSRYTNLYRTLGKGEFNVMRKNVGFILYHCGCWCGRLI